MVVLGFNAERQLRKPLLRHEKGLERISKPSAGVVVSSMYNVHTSTADYSSFLHAALKARGRTKSPRPMEKVGLFALSDEDCH